MTCQGGGWEGDCDRIIGSGTGSRDVAIWRGI